MPHVSVLCKFVPPLLNNLFFTTSQPISDNLTKKRYIDPWSDHMCPWHTSMQISAAITEKSILWAYFGQYCTQCTNTWTRGQGNNNYSTSLSSQNPWEKTNVPLFLGSMCSAERNAPVPSKGRGKWGSLKKLEKNPRFHEAWSSWNSSPVWCTDRVASLRLTSSVPSCCTSWWEEDEKLTSKYKVDLPRLPPCHSALKPHVQRVNHHELTNLFWKSQTPTMRTRVGQGLSNECWNRCGPAVLSYQPRWLISWTFVKKRKRKKRTSLTLTVSVKAIMSGGSDSGEPFPCNVWRRLLFCYYLLQ